MDKYKVSGKNKILYKGKNYILNYTYDIGLKKYMNEVELEIYRVQNDMILPYLEKTNFLEMIEKIKFKLNEYGQIERIINYEKLKLEILSKLILLEIKRPYLKEFLEYLEKKLETEKEFLSVIKEIDFINFLFLGNEEITKNKNFFGIIPNEDFEIIIKKEKKKFEEYFNYEMNTEFLNKKILKYRLNDEKIPNYFLEGKGVKKYKNNILQFAKLDLKSGDKEKFEREIILKIEKE